MKLIRVVCLVALVFGAGCSPVVSNLKAEGLAANGLAEPVLLFGIGMHIEPLGRTAQGYGGGADYRQGPLFERHVQDILAVAKIVEGHGGRMTVQAQSPFTQVALSKGNTILRDLETRGHEIALHFHEDAHLGRDPERLPVQTWCAVMQEEISYIQQAGAQKKIRYWSGGNLYTGVLEAASCAGLDVMSDWKNYKTQRTDLSLVGVHPWRPAGGPSETDLSKFATHDPNGKVIFLPEGNYSREDFASSRRAAGGDAAYFEYLKTELLRSLEVARADKVNVFHFTVHPGEFRGDPARPFGVIEDFLTNVVDPLVKAGKIRWATFSQMADEFIAWEKANPGVDPRGSAALPQRPDQSNPAGYITFAINVHDFRHIDESAETLLKLIAIFEKYNVKGDFYLTGPMADFYAQQRPDLVQKLKESGMTISYHQRPPHPLYTGFDSRLRGLSDDALKALLRDYETYKLDLATGELLRDHPGGYTYLAQLMGRKPVVATAPNNDPRVKKIAWQLYKELGAQMTVIYHESGTKLEEPFEWVEGVLVRPSDFSVTRWKTERVPQEQFWWNMLDTPHAADYNPTSYLKKKLSEWRGPRPPFITVLIHEDNFFRRGGTSWESIYYGPNRQPLSPPYNLNAPDPSQPRSQKSQELIWKAYEELVAYAATHLSVVTSEEIVAMARGTLAEQSQPPLPTERDVTYCTLDGVELKMDIYRPQGSAAPTPALLYVHGGGWTGGDKRSGEGIRDIPELLARGYLVAAVNYRLAPRYKFPAMIEDVKCAVRFLRANAERFSINPEKIGAWGGSAGGHLVALLGTADATAGWDVGQYLEQSSRVQAVVDMYGPTDLTVLFEGANPRLMEQVFGTSDRNSETLQKASPVNWVSSDDPPFLILHGERDPLVPVSQSQIFYEKLQAAGVPATFVIVKNAGHGFAPLGGPISPSRQELTKMIGDFFDQYLK
jgi:acetyl esterase/lipase